MSSRRGEGFSSAGSAATSPPMAAELPPVPGPEQLAESAASIAAAQTPSGAIPWEVTGETMGRVDPWDHVECAMALTCYGPPDAAERAYLWLASQQRADGTWPREWVADCSLLAAQSSGGADVRAARQARSQPRVVDDSFDSNMTAYVAVGVWQHWLTRGDLGFVMTMWPVVRAALDAVCALALPFGGIAWARSGRGSAATALVSGSASMHHALACGVALAQLLGHEAPRWSAVAEGIARALTQHEELFEPKRRFAMDWYYPVLGGVTRGRAGRERLAARWPHFVVRGLGVRCVDDHPWVTGAESCELALAALAVGWRDEARRIVADVQHLRAPDGAYHTGYVYPDGVRWPVERSTWTAAVVVLAADALAPCPVGGDVFGLGSTG